MTETERADLILRYRESGEYDSTILDWLNKARHKCAVLVNVPAV